jgi:hypothetical protein
MGALVILAGLLLTLAAKLRLGRLPGDIVMRRGNLSCHVPVLTPLLLSILLTLALNLIIRLVDK